jgi:hypothetical protein
MRLRFLWTSQAAEALDPALSRYVRTCLGKTVETTPDAWCYLKESPISPHISPAGVARNFERWLCQRDVAPDGVTVPTERVDRTFNAGGIADSEVDAFYDYLARRTDLAHGQCAMYFDLDDRLSLRGRVAIKVEIRDTERTSWRIEFAAPDGQVVSTPSYYGGGGGQVKTATFELAAPPLANSLPSGHDFRLVCRGPGDVVVRWVRVVRLTRP